MNVKYQLPVIIIFLLFVCLSCNKNNNSTSTNTATTTIANIDSITGTYTGITSVDSIYNYTDSAGKAQQWVHSFSWPDTLHVTSADTASITVVSKFYTVTFPYGDSLTLDYITDLQNTTGQNGYLAYNATLIDTTYFGNPLIGADHINVTVGYGYNKYYYSNVALYSRP